LFYFNIDYFQYLAESNFIDQNLLYLLVVLFY